MRTRRMSAFGGPCFRLTVEYLSRWFESHHSAASSFFLFGIYGSYRRRQRRQQQRRRARRCTRAPRGSTSAHSRRAVLRRSLMGFRCRGRSTATAAAPPALSLYLSCCSHFRARALAFARTLSLSLVLSRMRLPLIHARPPTAPPRVARPYHPTVLHHCALLHLLGHC